MRFLIKSDKYNEIFYFIIATIFCTIIGTLTHELSHFYVAKYLNIPVKLHFNRVSFNEKYNLFDINDKNTIQYFYVRLAGPIQTIIFGLLGFVGLYLKRYKKFNYINWFFTFLSFFLLREVLVMGVYFYDYFFVNKFLVIGDEAFISYFLSLPFYTINLIAGFISIIIILYVLKYIIPKSYLLNLLFGLFVGSIMGYIIWFNLIGKLILP
jgi:hypothetical protein